MCWYITCMDRVRMWGWGDSGSNEAVTSCLSSLPTSKLSRSVTGARGERPLEMPSECIPQRIFSTQGPDYCLRLPQAPATGVVALEDGKIPR